MDIEIIHKNLRKRFDHHRIVFWIDEDDDLRNEFDSVDLEGISKVEWKGPGFGLKHRMMRQEPEQYFLVYRSGVRPDDEDNWLLDVMLSHDEFAADQTALWIADIGLLGADRPLIERHSGFFNAESRRDELKSRLSQEKNREDLRKHMLAICMGVSEPRIDSVLERVLQDVSEDRDERYKKIERANLTDFLWSETASYYGYRNSDPSPKDFALQLFSDRLAYAMDKDQHAKLSPEICLFFDRWRKEPKYVSAFKSLSTRYETDLNAEGILSSLNPDDLKGIETFRIVDVYLLQALTREVQARRMSPERVKSFRDARRYSPWYAEEFQKAYDGLCYGADFLVLAETVQKTSHSFDEGIERYATEWWKLDFLYRKFMSSISDKFKSIFRELQDEIEGKYENGYLLPLNDNWQKHIDQSDVWKGGSHLYQRNFFTSKVKPSLKKARTVVIISDALRYEVGQELVPLLRGIDRYDADIQPAVSVLPSYTQLGMAALLPHTSLQILENSSAHVETDTGRAAGIDGRHKILQRADDKYGALRAKDFMDMDRDTARAHIKELDCLYIYHNVIDSVGDKRDTEHKLFEACETAVSELVDIIKKLAAANVSYMFVTADHGFIFQNRKTGDSDFLSEGAEGEDILYTDRRFVLGRGLQEKAGLKTFAASELGLEGDMQIQLPKSINRLRKSGSGSRFVHGGASLQEIVIPVISIHKARSSDTSQVDVDILVGSSKSITSAQHTFRLFQTDPVSEKLTGRTLKAGIYGDDGTLLSNEEERIFDSSSKSATDREYRVTLFMNHDADTYKGKSVYLKLRERIDGTSQYKDYGDMQFKLKRHMGTDF